MTSVSTPSPTTTIAPAAVTPRTNLQSIFEDDDLLAANNGHEATAFAVLKGLGVQTLRVFVTWGNFAPDTTSTTTPKVNLKDPSSYEDNWWSYLDGIDRAAAAAHITVLFDVGPAAPRWALGKDPQTETYVGSWKPNATDYGDFMTALGRRYSGTYTPSGQSSPLPRVSDWSIWNEPNAVYLSPNVVGKHNTPYSARLYRGLVDAAWQGLTSTGHTPANDTILIGETAPRGVKNPGNSSGLVPLTFIRAVYCVSDDYKPLSGSAATTLGCPASGSITSFRQQNPGLFEATGWSNHPYSDASAPDIKVPASDGVDSQDYSDFASLGNLETALDGVFEAYGSKREIPIYSTEYGYKTNPPTSLGVSDTTAAAWMNQAEYLSWLNPRIRSYSHYLLVDPPVSTGNDFDTGLQSPTATTKYNGVGNPKPDVYDAYRLPLWLPRTSAAKAQKLEVWGCARPVNDEAVAAATVDVQFAAGTSESYHTVKAVTLHPRQGGCYFTTEIAFPATGTVRLSYDAGGSTMVSRTQAITVH